MKTSGCYGIQMLFLQYIKIARLLRKESGN